MSREMEEYIQEEEAREAEYGEGPNIFDVDGENDALFQFNLRQEIHSQVLLVKALRSYLFTPAGVPKIDTEATAITSYMNTSMKLLGMLKEMEDSLKTDEEVRRIEMAVEMAMEDVPCPEFVEAFEKYIRAEEGL